jgi:hypothetical protein
MLPIIGTMRNGRSACCQQREHNTVPGSWPTSNVVVASLAHCIL